VSEATGSPATTVSMLGWRIWDLYAGRDIEPQTMGRGVRLHFNRDGALVPDVNQQVNMSELAMIMDLFQDQPLFFPVDCEGDDHTLPGMIDRLISRLPALAGRMFQIDQTMKGEAFDKLLAVKRKHKLSVIMLHTNVLGAELFDPVLQVVDQVSLEIGAGRGAQPLTLDDRAVGSVRLVATTTKAPVMLTGRMSAQNLKELTPQMGLIRSIVSRPIAIAAEAQRTADGQLDLSHVQTFFDSAAKLTAKPASGKLTAE
jgi:hypothetical protein